MAQLTAAHDDDITTSISTVLVVLADLLEVEPEAAWDAPSLCDGWTVRNVVAHMTMAARYPPTAFMAELRADEGDMARLIDRIAARDGANTPASLVDDLRNEDLHAWEPPGGGAEGALLHASIHAVDATLPLGLAPRLPRGSLATVLEILGGGACEHFGVDLSGIALRASDLDWSHGFGRPLVAPAAELIALMAARTLGPQPTQSLSPTRQ